jgi:hypothetical protein
VIFEDGTAEIPSDYHDPSHGPLTPSTGIEEGTGLTPCSHAPSSTSYGSESTAAGSSPGPVNFGQPENRLTTRSFSVDRTLTSPFGNVSILRTANTTPALLSGGRPLCDVTEGFLLHHFSHVVGPWVGMYNIRNLILY